MLETVKNFNTKHPAGDGDFFIKLIALRSLLPGCSFTEPMIHRICRNLPTTKEEFTKSTELDIDECEPFFEDFLMVIRDYLNKRNDPQKENDEEKSNTNNNDTDNPIDEQIEKTTLETKIQADTLGIVEKHSRMHKCSDFFEKAFIETVFGEPSETDTSNNEENSSNSTTYADSEETSIPSSIPEQITSQTGHIAPANDSEPVLQETPIYGLDKTWSELTELANAEKEEYKNNLLNEDTDKRLTMRLRVLIENIKKNGKFLALWGVTPEDISLFRPKSEIALYIHCHFDKNDAEEYGQQFIDEINDYEAHPYNDTSALYDYLQAAKKILPDCYCNEYMLWTIATNRPHTKDELLTLQGIGKITCDRFGNTLLAVINEFEKRHPPLETNNEIIDDNLETPSADASDALDDNNIETFDESIADAEEDKAESESQSVDFDVYEDFDPTFDPTEDLDIDDTPAFNVDDYDTNFNFTPNGEDTTSDSAENDAPDFDIDPDMEE